MNPKIITFVNWILYILIALSFIQVAGSWFEDGKDLFGNPVVHSSMLLIIIGFLFNQNVKPSKPDEKQSNS